MRILGEMFDPKFVLGERPSTFLNIVANSAWFSFLLTLKQSLVVWG